MSTQLKRKCTCKYNYLVLGTNDAVGSGSPSVGENVFVGRGVIISLSSGVGGRVNLVCVGDDDALAVGITCTLGLDVGIKVGSKVNACVGSEVCGTLGLKLVTEEGSLVGLFVSAADDSVGLFVSVSWVVGSKVVSGAPVGSSMG